MNPLTDTGVIVIPFPEHIRSSFNLHTFLTEQKEFINPTADTLFVMGGFGALGNPSSFHHPQVRQLRLSLFNYTKSLFAELYPNRYIECLPDRFCIRNPGTSLSAESWHRDISNVSKNEKRGPDDDVIYGGWANLDENNTQYFSCVPNTHTENSDNNGGFAKIQKEQAVAYKARRQRISIPPGHMLIFNEKTVHEVCPTKQKVKSYRLFLKYRITTCPEPLFPDNQQIALDQGVFPLSLAQIPPIYGKLHAVCWKERLEEFSKNIQPAFLDTNASSIRVQRFMPPLKNSNLGMFIPYKDEELDILTPTLL